jgi:hypothetical protein
MPEAQISGKITRMTDPAIYEKTIREIQRIDLDRLLRPKYTIKALP